MSKVTAPQDAHGRLVLQVDLHFRVQCYTYLLVLGKVLLSHKTWICAANLLEVESLKVQSSVAS